MSIHSEIDFLEKVLVHRPGVEHKFILPSQTNEILVVNDIMKKNPDFILFDENKLSHVLKPLDIKFVIP